MPQLNAEWYLPQIVWLFISLGLLYWLLRTKALPRVAEILDQRQRRMSTDLERAAAQRREAEEIMTRYEATIAEARERAKTLLAENQAKLQAEAGRRQAELEEQLGRRLAEAERDIARAREQALGQLQAVAAEVAQAATERLIGVKVSRKAAEAALRDERRERAAE